MGRNLFSWSFPERFFQLKQGRSFFPGSSTRRSADDEMERAIMIIPLLKLKKELFSFRIPSSTQSSIINTRERKKSTGLLESRTQK